jgi:hypothetical protein
MMNSVNSERSSNQADSKIDRNMILSWLKEDTEWLRNKARSDKPGKNIVRVQLFRACIYACSVILQALRDTEIEQIMKEIEEIKKQIGLEC